MNRFYTFVMAACTYLAALASPSEPLKITEFTPDPMEPAATAPFKVSTAKASDADYTEWESLGTATLEQNFKYFANSLNNYRTDEDEEIVFNLTTKVMTRRLHSDASVRQIKFCNFLGYNDMVGDYDATTGIISIPRTPTGIPVPSGLATGFNCTSIDFQAMVLYSEARRIFDFRNVWLLVYENSGFNFGSLSATLPDARPELGFYFSRKSGGYKSTDTSVTFEIEKNGIDHIRYITRHTTEGFRFSDISDIATGSCDYKESDSEVTVNYNEGYGLYMVLSLAFDAEDKYMGIYRTISMISNLAPEGTWKSLGKGLWRNPALPDYDIYDYQTGTTKETISFPAEVLNWEVEIEKRTDTDREIYRVVNPYSPSCGFADIYNDMLDKIYADEIYADEPARRPDAFSSDDTFWFVFDATDPNNIAIEQDRPNGLMEDYIMSTNFGAISLRGAKLKDKCLIIPNYSSNGNGTALIVELPGFRGIGFEMYASNEENIYGDVSTAVAEVRYVIIPAESQKPSEAEFAAEAARIASGASTYEVHRTTPENTIAKLPYGALITGPSWMLVVPVDNAGNAFDYSVVPLAYRKVFSGVTLEESLLSPFTTSSAFFGTFNGLTVTQITWPQTLNINTYVLDCPYTNNDPGWYGNVSYKLKEVGQWIFEQKTDDNGEEKLEMYTVNTGLSVDNIFAEDGDYYLTASFGYGTRNGDEFTFPIFAVGVEGYSSLFDPKVEGACFRFTIPDAGSGAIDDVKAGTDDANAPVEYFDLQGRKVTNPSGGIYIRRQGSHTSKILVK